MGSGDPNPGLHTFIASILPMEHLQSPKGSCFKVENHRDGRSEVTGLSRLLTRDLRSLLWTAGVLSQGWFSQRKGSHRGEGGAAFQCLLCSIEPVY